MENELLPVTFVSVFDALDGAPLTVGPSTFDPQIESALFEKKIEREVKKALGIYGLMGRELLTIGDIIYSVPSLGLGHYDLDILNGYTGTTR